MERRSTPTDHEQLLTTETVSSRVQLQDESLASERWSPLKLTSDFAAIAVPLCVLGLTIVLNRLDGQEVDAGTYAAWRNAITVLATVFPIMFAAIMGRTMYEAARWRLEQGVAMDTLEQIMGSRSVGAAVTTLVQLRSLNFLSALLLLVWALSPLGSQSIARTLSSRLESRDTSIELMTFLNLHACGARVFQVSVNSGSDVFTQPMDLILGASVVSSTAAKIGTMDLWGNVKIPFLPVADLAGGQWRVLDDDDEADLERYSSLIGIPVGNVSEGNTTFSLETSYMELQCFNMTQLQLESVDSWNISTDVEWTWEKFYSSRDSRLIPANGSWQGSNDSVFLRADDWNIAVNRFIDPYWFNSTKQKPRFEALQHDHPEQLHGQDLYDWMVDPARFAAETNIEVEVAQLMFQAQYYKFYSKTQHLLKVQCNIRQRYIESRVVCEREPGSSPEQRKCAVKAQRASQASHPDERITHVSFPHVWGRMSFQLRLAIPGNNRGDVISQYLDDSALRHINDHMINVFDHVNRDIFGRRLSQILNSYILASQLGLGATTGLSPEYRVPNVTAPANVVTLVEVYDVSRVWVTMAIVCCCVLVVAGALSVVFRHLALGPEVLGFASTVVRDSKFMDLPPGTGQMAGLDISRMLQGERVRYGYSDLTAEGKPLVGVGRAGEIKSLKLALGDGSSEL